MRRWLEQIRGSADDYAWIGFANQQGRVVEATDGARVGEDVSQMPWFRAALQGASASEQPERSPKKANAATLSAEAGRGLDIAEAVLDGNGQIVGVLAAQVNWSWVGEIRDLVIGSLKRDHGWSTSSCLNPAGSGDPLDHRGPVGKDTPRARSARPRWLEDGVFRGAIICSPTQRPTAIAILAVSAGPSSCARMPQIALAPVRTLCRMKCICVGAWFLDPCRLSPPGPLLAASPRPFAAAAGGGVRTSGKAPICRCLNIAAMQKLRCCHDPWPHWSVISKSRERELAGSNETIGGSGP